MEHYPAKIVSSALITSNDTEEGYHDFGASTTFRL